MSNFIRFPDLSQVSTIETLRRHFQHALDYGTNPVAAEYLAEIERREKFTVTESRRKAA